MARRQNNKLTALGVTKLTKPGRHSDGGGLYLSIDDAGRKRWVFMYRVGSKRREMGLGSAAAGCVSLADARAAAGEARALRASGRDPLEHRAEQDRQVEAEQQRQDLLARTPTFGDYADKYVEQHRSTWSNDKHAAQWKMTLNRHCQPIRAQRIDEVDTKAVLSVLRPIWSRVPETAQRLRGRIEKVLDAAKVEGFRSDENPAQWRGHLSALLPARSPSSRHHYNAQPFERMGEVMSVIRAHNTMATRLLEFCILTAVRPGAARTAKWANIDLAKGIWTIPAENMKVKREHRVPLSSAATGILTALQPLAKGSCVFPGRKGSAMSEMAMAKVLKRIGYRDITVHGFRSTFCDWAHETQTASHEVIEMALAHTIKNKTEAAYRRGDLFEKRRAVMEAWSTFCSQPAQNNIIPLKRHA